MSAVHSTELAIGGMTFATETARVTFPAVISTGDLVSMVEQAGYTAAPAADAAGGPG